MEMYYINDTNIHIKDSYKLSKKEFCSLIKEMRLKFVNPVLQNRSDYSLKMEWACHTLAYYFNISRDRAKNVDLNYPLKWYEKVIYNIFGPISWLLVA